MRRRSQVSLVLASSIPLVLSGCSVDFEDDDAPATHNFDQTMSFQSVQECVDQKIPVNVCSEAYIQAQNEHRRIAPHYDSKDACDADFVAGYCQADGANGFVPKVGGFEVRASGALTDAQYRQAQEQAQQQQANGHGSSVTGAVVGGGVGLLTGYMLGQALNNRNSVQYQSRPVSSYDRRDDRNGSSYSGGSYRPSSNANSSKWSTLPSSSNTRDTLGNNLRNNGSKASNGWDSRTSSSRQDASKSSASSSVSRGGFGSQATARSGWGGSSSSGKSSGASSGG